MKNKYLYLIIATLICNINFIYSQDTSIDSTKNYIHDSINNELNIFQKQKFECLIKSKIFNQMEVDNFRILYGRKGYYNTIIFYNDGQQVLNIKVESLDLKHSRKNKFELFLLFKKRKIKYIIYLR